MNIVSLNAYKMLYIVANKYAYKMLYIVANITITIVGLLILLRPISETS